ncbi:threonine/serine exporter family protein [Cellulomonas sp. ATA003]|uniref:threonine/serine ThrE exporter family protein n=1 Tax=Cellulomonas sp. ATA003 TaxID=3073064 RepID=UPI002873656A|nr:threonine/serine exporter family protein [Cellulomonas sp. ATA003]WNB86412.1 threonine/serine exporter family protein [Cellulomonas sp. ATA003]
MARRTAGSPPTVQVGRRSRGGGLGEETVRSVLQLAVRIGEAMLSLGAAAADVTDSIKRVVRSFGLECEVDLTFTAILVSHDPGPGASPVTVLRVVESRSADYGRLTGVLELAGDLTAGVADDPEDAQSSSLGPAAVDRRVERAHDRLDEIVSAPHPYRRSLVTAVLSAMAAGVAVLLGGGIWVVLVAAATTAVIDVVISKLGRWGLPPFFLQVAGAAIATTVAVLLLVLIPLLPVDLQTLPPSLVVASGIVVLLAGLSLVGAAEDAISGFPVTASARVFEVILLTLGIVVGIGAVLDVARRLGVPFALVDVRADPAPLALQALGAAVVAGAWAMASYARPRAALVAATVGGAGFLLFTALREIGGGPAVASAGAAVAIGFAAETLSRRLGVPAIVTSVCGIVPLLPGLTIYRGLFRLIDESSGVSPGLQILLQAATVGLGLAAGVTLGELLARPVRARLQRIR